MFQEASASVGDVALTALSAETRPPWGQSGSNLGRFAKLAMAREPHPLRLATSSAVDAAIIIISDDFHYGTFPHRICLKRNEAMSLKALDA